MNRTCLALILFAIAAASADAQPAQWAVLIGVQKHNDPQLDLGCTTSDVARLREVLRERGGVPEKNMLVMTDDSPAPQRPTLANLRREVPAFLKKVGKDDRIIVFYAGHGFLRDGKTYLVPKDTNTNKLDTTALPAAELNKALEEAPGKLKFLILDCCHAGGSTRALTMKQEAAETLADAVQPKNGVAILASCRKGESSWEWADHRQGMFSYWLCQALQGAADANGDGVLDVAEIYDYTHERVSGTVKKLFGKDQTPVRMIDASVDGALPVLTLLPEPPDSLLKRLAEELDLELRMRKIKSVGVLEFVATLGKAEKKLAQSNLPKYCAEKLRALLTELGEGAYRVVDDEKLGPAARGMKLEEIGDAAKLTKVSASAGGMEAVLTGGLRRYEETLHVNCDLVRIATGKSLARPAGVLPLSEDLLGDLGYSFDTLKRPIGAPTDKNVVANALKRLVKGSPLGKEEFPFKIAVYIVEPRPGEKEITKQTPRRLLEPLNVPVDSDDPNVRSELVIAVKEGDIMELKVTNDSLDQAAMNLYVDGLNTIGQGRELIGKGSARVLERGKTYTIEGWAFPDAREMKRFEFAKLPKSVAGRQTFGESIGTITAAFYGRAGRALGVGERPSERRTFKIDDTNFVPGRLLGIVNIRYVDKTSLP